MNHWTAYDRWEQQQMTLSPETRDAVRDGCKRSAAAVLPVVFNTLGMPSAMLDVGGGEGHWTNAAAGLGVARCLNVDVTGGMNEYGYWSAETGEPLPGCPDAERWPLALCLEMAEHVTPAAGDHLVAELCRVATEIVWSAAIPGQGGDGHINEQWPDYWAERFAQHGFTLDDPWRLDIWNDDRIECWYRQNLLYAYRGAPGSGDSHPVIGNAPLSLVHPEIYCWHVR